MELGRTTTRVAGAFKKSYLRDDRMDFRYMNQFLFQEDHPIHKLFSGAVRFSIEEKSIKLKISVGRANVNPPSRKASGYQLDAILLHGDPSKNKGTKIKTAGSRLYSFDEQGEIYCELMLPFPPGKQPWLVLLHIGCTMNDGLPAGPRYHAMWAVKAG
jgi:hypothetical protein